MVEGYNQVKLKPYGKEQKSKGRNKASTIPMEGSLTATT